jgi:hypothetical protein
MVRNRLSRADVCKDTIPSFEQFIEYVLQTAQTTARINRMDFHWQPYSVLCQVCKFRYNFIGKYETFNEDFTYFLKGLNLSDWNIEKRHGASGRNTSYYQELYSTLPDELICHLIRLYDDDFRLFNYRVNDYINRTTFLQSCSQSRTFKPMLGRPTNMFFDWSDPAGQRFRPSRSDRSLARKSFGRIRSSRSPAGIEKDSKLVQKPATILNNL